VEEAKIKELEAIANKEREQANIAE